MIEKLLKRTILYAVPVLLAAGALWLNLEAAVPPVQSVAGPNVVINNKAIRVMIADEFEEQAQGLSDRRFLGADNGMLFIFQRKQVQRFWMRNMRFPIDIIWIDDGRVVKIDKRLEPEGEAPVKRYNSGVPVNYVLEVNGGLADAFGIEAGDRVEINID